MRRRLSRILPILLLSIAPLSALALEVPLHTVQFPERRTIDVPFTATAAAPAGAKLAGEVKAEGPNTRIDLDFQNLQPAVLFGGQVNSYVVWTVTRDGVAQNVGELWSDEPRGSSRFRTGLKEFAMIVTAERIPGGPRPSDLVIFVSEKVDNKFSKNSEFSYSTFRTGIVRDVQSIGNLRYTGQEPLELYQARRIFEMGELAKLREYDARSMEEATTTLAQATNSANHKGSKKVIADYSRRTVALVSTASRAMVKAVALREEEELAAKRKAELDALGQKAAEAQQSAAESEAARLRAEAEAGRLATERHAAEQTALASEAARREAEEALRTAEKAKAEASEQAAALAAEKETLSTERDRIQKERDALQQRLSAALSGVATTQTTARGIIVSLPGIFFDTGRAVLKPKAQVGLAKMAGVLSVFPDMNLRVEGYTDSTGTLAVNEKLSRARAASVATFLQEQGIGAPRIVTEGYGPQFPVAPNDTPAGRAKNRRVEVVLAEGVVPPPSQ